MQPNHRLPPQLHSRALPQLADSVSVLNHRDPSEPHQKPNDHTVQLWHSPARLQNCSNSGRSCRHTVHAPCMRVDLYSGITPSSGVSQPQSILAKWLQHKTAVTLTPVHQPRDAASWHAHGHKSPNQWSLRQSSPQCTLHPSKQWTNDAAWCMRQPTCPPHTGADSHSSDCHAAQATPSRSRRIPPLDCFCG